MMLIQTDKTVI